MPQNIGGRRHVATIDWPRVGVRAAGRRGLCGVRWCRIAGRLGAAPRRSGGPVRGVARLPAARARGGGSRLHRHGDVRAVPGPRAIPPAPRRHRHARVARRPAGGLAPRAGGNERARFRSPGPQAVGQQPGLLRDVLPFAERPAGARGPAGVRRRRTLELPCRAQCRGRDADRCRRPRHPRPADAGAGQPRGQRPRSLGVWHHQHPGAERGSRAVRRAAGRRARQPEGAGARGEARDRRVRRMARSRGAEEDRALGHRHRPLRLVSQERAPCAVHLARATGARPARTRAGPRVSRARGAAQPPVCRRRSRSPAPTHMPRGSPPPCRSTWPSCATTTS